MLFRLDKRTFASLLREAGIVAGPARFAVQLYHTTEGSHQMAEITVKDSSAPLSATVTFLDAKGAETSPDDTPAWSSSDETVTSVTASDDGLSATLTIGLPGVALIEVRSVDTDGTEVVAQGTVTVQPGEAVIGSVEFAEAPA